MVVLAVFVALGVVVTTALQARVPSHAAAVPAAVTTTHTAHAARLGEDRG